MQNLYDEVASLDARCYKEFHLSEDLLMEHAASGMAAYIQKNFPKNSNVIVVVGSGNNGADGLALARLLHGEYSVEILYAKEPKSPMAQLQHKRNQALKIPTTQTLHSCDIIVDALVGTGFQGEFSLPLQTLIEEINTSDAFVIACDVPSGYEVYADVTLTMGALKKTMFLDKHKDKVGTIEVIDLGISRTVYELPTHWKLLDTTDLQLPFRSTQDTHKGSFGHLALLSGEKLGASVLAGEAALRFGAGLVTLVGFDEAKQLPLPYSLMYSHTIPKNTTAIACGMGLGESFTQKELLTLLPSNIPLILDADILSNPLIEELLQRDNVIITPHPKEFVSLLKQLHLADISVEELQNNRFKYVELFSKHFLHVSLLLKGANVIIAHEGEFFINPHGSAKLAKGGSGDILAGLIASLVAQGFSCKDALLNASLTHTLLAKNYSGADFSLTPEDLIAGLGKL